MAWLTTTQVATHISHDLSSEAITRLLDDAEEDIIARFGAHATQVDYLIGGAKLLFPTRPISSVTSIVETSGTTDTTLAASDYAIKGGGWQLKRLNTGTNAQNAWAPEVTVTYVPTDDLDRRNRVGLDLIRLALQFTGLQGLSDGDHSEQSAKYQREREGILGGLNARRRNYA